MSYTRVKKVPPKKPNQELYEKKVQLIEKYEMLEDLGKLDIYYFDDGVLLEGRVVFQLLQIYLICGQKLTIQLQLKHSLVNE